MDVFRFAIQIGQPDDAPESVEYVYDTRADDALERVLDVIHGRHGLGRPHDKSLTVNLTWRGFFERGCKMPDCSMWDFNIGEFSDGAVMNVIGHTEAEWADIDATA